MNRKLLQLFGLKFNPFSPELPLEALRLTPAVAECVNDFETLIPGI
jgi:hypothetical protein